MIEEEIHNTKHNIMQYLLRRVSADFIMVNFRGAHTLYVTLKNNELPVVPTFMPKEAVNLSEPFLEK